MPYLDLPSRREKSAPILNTADHRTIFHYFEDLELLFIRHLITDDSEKKRAAVNYPDVEVEHLWKCPKSFSDPARSYEEFKADVIRIYPELLEARQYTISTLQ